MRSLWGLALALAPAWHAAPQAALREGRPEPPPRVLRGPLDGRPAAVVVGFGRGLWAAWDTRSGALVEAWTGDVVRVDGLLESLGAVQDVGPEVPVFELRYGARRVLGRAEWEGHRLVAGRVELAWRIVFEDGAEVLLVERPRGTTLGDLAKLDLGARDSLALERAFRATGVPRGAELWRFFQTHGTQVLAPLFTQVRHVELRADEWAGARPAERTTGWIPLVDRTTVEVASVYPVLVGEGGD